MDDARTLRSALTVLRTVPTDIVTPVSLPLRRHSVLGRALTILALSAVALSGCSGPTAAPGDPPTLVRPSDQTVLRNTAAPVTVAVTFSVDDADTLPDDLIVTAFSDAQDVVPDGDLAPTCADGTCTLTFVPDPSTTATVGVTLRVSDGTNIAEDRFFVRLIPRWVTSANDDGPGSLRAAITAAETGDVIGFDRDSFPPSPESPTEIVLTGGRLLLERDVTIEGVGRRALVLRGDSSGRLVSVGSGADVVITGMTLTGGTGDDCSAILGSAVSCGGAILVNEAAKLALVDLVVTDNRALFGAGIFVHDAVLSISSGRLDLHVANTGGALYLRGGSARLIDTGVVDNDAGVRGGGIYALGADLSLEASRVTGNRSRDGAGIASVGFSTLNLTGGSLVADNDATGIGGGILHQGGDATIDASTIATNTANRGAGLFNGPSGTMTVQNGSLVRDNRASGFVAEGAGAFNAEGGTLRLLDSTARANHSASDGGAVSSHGPLVIRDSVVADNFAGDYGAAVYVSAPATVANSLLNGNVASDHGAAVYLDGTSIVVTASTLEGNTAQFDGGAIYAYYGEVVLRDGSIVRDNRAGARGGGVFVTHGSVSLLASTLAANASGTGPLLDDAGGGIFATVSSVVIDASDVADNLATGADGGGVYAASSDVVVRAASTIRGNVAGASGGGIVVVNGTLDVDASAVRDNTAVDGGGLVVRDGSADVHRGSSVAGNVATNSGGGIATEDGASILIDGSSVHHNEAGVNGGGILHLSGALLSVRNSSVANNRATGGGGILAVSSGVALDATTVEENVATNASGGGISVINAELGVANGTVVRANTAARGGGGIVVDNATLRLRDSTVGGTSPGDGNHTDRDGGGVLSRLSGVFLETGSTIASNRAAGDGGGLWLSDVTVLSLDGATLTENTAEGLGGAVYYDVPDGSSDSLTAVEVTDNAASDGGGFYRAGAHGFDVSDVSFDGNAPNDTAP